MRKVIFTLATGLFLVAGVTTSNACDGTNKKVTKASTSQAAATTAKKECSTADKKACATTTKTASAQKSCCMSKTNGVEAKAEVKKTGKPEAKL